SVAWYTFNCPECWSSGVMKQWTEQPSSKTLLHWFFIRPRPPKARGSPAVAAIWCRAFAALLLPRYHRDHKSHRSPLVREGPPCGRVRRRRTRQRWSLRRTGYRPTASTSPHVSPAGPRRLVATTDRRLRCDKSVPERLPADPNTCAIHDHRRETSPAARREDGPRHESNRSPCPSQRASSLARADQR